MVKAFAIAPPSIFYAKALALYPKIDITMRWC